MHDLAPVQEKVPFYPFGAVVQVGPMPYGEIVELARRHTTPGETACLLIDLGHKMVSLAVDLALNISEYSGKKPVCMYMQRRRPSSDKIRVMVKYPSPHYV